MNLDVFKRLRKRLKKGSKADAHVEAARRDKLERDAMRAKAKTDRKRAQRQTDTAFEEVVEATCEVSGIFPPHVGLNGVAKSARELADEAYDDAVEEKEARDAEQALRDFDAQST